MGENTLFLYIYIREYLPITELKQSNCGKYHQPAGSHSDESDFQNIQNVTPGTVMPVVTFTRVTVKCL